MELHFVITMVSVSLLDAKLSFNVILCIFLHTISRAYFPLILKSNWVLIQVKKLGAERERWC